MRYQGFFSLLSAFGLKVMCGHHVDFCLNEPGSWGGTSKVFIRETAVEKCERDLDKPTAKNIFLTYHHLKKLLPN